MKKDKAVIGGVLLIIFFAIAWWSSTVIFAPKNFHDKLSSYEKVMVNGDENNNESVRTFAKLDTMVQSSNYPVQFKREVSNCYVWLDGRVNEPRKQFNSDTKKVFININNAVDEVNKYYNNQQQ